MEGVGVSPAAPPPVPALRVAGVEFAPFDAGLDFVHGQFFPVTPEAGGGGKQPRPRELVLPVPRSRLLSPGTFGVGRNLQLGGCFP